MFHHVQVLHHKKLEKYDRATGATGVATTGATGVTGVAGATGQQGITGATGALPPIEQFLWLQETPGDLPITDNILTTITFNDPIIANAPYFDGTTFTAVTAGVYQIHIQINWFFTIAAGSDITISTLLTNTGGLPTSGYTATDTVVNQRVTDSPRSLTQNITGRFVFSAGDTLQARVLVTGNTIVSFVLQVSSIWGNRVE